jgi:hypothetical protein
MGRTLSFCDVRDALTQPDCSEIIRKSDYHFRDEPRGGEVGRALRAIAALSGSRLGRGKV